MQFMLLNTCLVLAKLNLAFSRIRVIKDDNNK